MQIAFFKGAATGAGLTAVIVTLPVSGPTLLIAGGTLAIGASSYMGYQRYQAGQTAGDAVLGGLADGTGVNFIYGSFANEDLVTGESLNLSSIEMAERQGNVFGGFIVAPMTGVLREGIVLSLPQGALKNRYLALAFSEMVDQGIRQSGSILIDEALLGSIRETAERNTLVINPGSPAAGSLNLMANGDGFLINAANRRVLDGYFDVIGHGTATTIRVDNLASGQQATIDHRSLARLLRANPEWTGQSVRLLSCNAGSSPRGMAQGLADQLGVQVMAPNNILWAYSNGTFRIGPGQNVNGVLIPAYPLNGRWIMFRPRGARTSN